MTDKEILTEWLIKFGMEWVDWNAIRELYKIGDTARAYLWGLKHVGYLDAEHDVLNTQTKFKLTQKALDCINGR